MRYNVGSESLPPKKGQDTPSSNADAAGATHGKSSGLSDPGALTRVGDQIMAWGNACVTRACKQLKLDLEGSMDCMTAPISQRIWRCVRIVSVVVLFLFAMVYLIVCTSALLKWSVGMMMMTGSARGVSGRPSPLLLERVPAGGRVMAFGRLAGDGGMPRKDVAKPQLRTLSSLRAGLGLPGFHREDALQALQTRLETRMSALENRTDERDGSWKSLENRVGAVESRVDAHMEAPAHAGSLVAVRLDEERIARLENRVDVLSNGTLAATNVCPLLLTSAPHCQALDEPTEFIELSRKYAKALDELASVRAILRELETQRAASAQTRVEELKGLRVEIDGLTTQLRAVTRSDADVRYIRKVAEQYRGALAVNGALTLTIGALTGGFIMSRVIALRTAGGTQMTVSERMAQLVGYAIACGKAWIHYASWGLV